MGKGVVLPGAGSRVPLPASLTDFRQESYWDEFFKASKGRPFEWYGDWTSLPKVFLEFLGLSPSRQPPLQILVPGCGNSALSAMMYDAGFHNIVNVDFNKRVVMEMLRLHVRVRPLMKWQVMDITKMQFADCSFDVVLDKGSLDALSGEPDEPQDAAKGFLAEWFEKNGGATEVMAISAKRGDGVDKVKQWLLGRLPYGPAYYPKDIVSEHPERFFVAEILREKIFIQYRQEIPYVCQVNVTSYMERRVTKDYIQLEIVVEKDGQKGILLGKGGQALKTLATAARLDIEDFVGKEVFVEIKVKVKEDWRENEELLDHYGYSGKMNL